MGALCASRACSKLQSGGFEEPSEKQGPPAAIARRQQQHANRERESKARPSENNSRVSRSRGSASAVRASGGRRPGEPRVCCRCCRCCCCCCCWRMVVRCVNELKECQALVSPASHASSCCELSELGIGRCTPSCVRRRRFGALMLRCAGLARRRSRASRSPLRSHLWPFL